MKLVQKKCPNCGASLSFEKDDKKVTCDYCKQEFLVEKDNDDFKIQSEKFAQKTTYTIFSLAAVIIVIGIIIFFFIFTRISKSFDSSSPKLDVGEEKEPIVSKPKNTYISEISQIDDKSLDLLKQASVSSLDKWADVSHGTTKSEWQYVGLYLLNHKTSNDNELYVVCKSTYTIKKKKIDAYAAISYHDLKLTEDKGVIYTGTGFPHVPMQFLDKKFGDNFFGETIYGYYSDKDLYNEVIKSKIVNYEVSSTDNMYMGN